jgi:hypothetical protein
MTRFVYSFIITILFAACGNDAARQKEARLNEKELNRKEKESLPEENPAPGTTDTITVPRPSAPPQPDTLQTEFKEFADFLEHFRKAAGQKKMKLIAEFVNFPFDEQDGLWTKPVFIKNFQISNDVINIIRKAVPKQIRPGIYSLENEEIGLRFQKNKEGNWKWFSIYYAD